MTLFSEFQTYACNGNEWSGSSQTIAYFRALEDQYRRALAIFHGLARGSAVSLGWGGWQARWDAPATGGGRSLFARFSAIMRESDFESFEVIDSATAPADILAMTRTLARYGPVMLAYYKPTQDSPAAAGAQLRAVLSAGFLERLLGARMFAFSFMDTSFATAEPASVATVRAALSRFGCDRCAALG